MEGIAPDEELGGEDCATVEMSSPGTGVADCDVVVSIAGLLKYCISSTLTCSLKLDPGVELVGPLVRLGVLIWESLLEDGKCVKEMTECRADDVWSPSGFSSLLLVRLCTKSGRLLSELVDR